MHPSEETTPAAPAVIEAGDFIPLQPLSEKGTTTDLSISAAFEGNVAVNMPPPKPGVFFFVLLLLAIAWTLAGVGIFGVCFFYYKHYHAAIWALASAILSTVTLLWGLLLYGSARHCQKRVAEANPSLLTYGGYGTPDV
ncbi:hypothetical protein HPB50_014659 [Hyalomma asiaticum]|uniref:Uncharacterized protein n=1 Tax=Hyalomma asiaticum TaxID=266040 RepID=A0ACB7SBL6_HYAAI|nr:hypothetical protein HPB50_014659 [Hyalomma asiaticum]